MPRRVEDIVRTDKRSIRNAPVEKERPTDVRRKAGAAVSGSSVSETEQSERSERASQTRGKDESSREIPLHRMRVMPPTPPTPSQTKPKKRKEPNGKGRKLWIGIAAAIVLVVAASGYVASAYFSRATFTITPVVVPISANNATIVALATSTPGYLKYSVLQSKGAASTTIPASDGLYISAKATGSVTIYNAYSKSPQRLIAGTRLTAPGGLIYRLTGTVTVPGYSISSAGTKKPGSVKATILADKSGAEYNIAKSAGIVFKLPAYEGSPKYDEMNATAAVDISGGFEGRKKTVDPQLLASTTKEMQEGLRSALLVQAKNSVPAGSIMYDNAYTVSYASPVVGGSDPRSATVTVSATVYSVVFKKADLVAKLGGQKLGPLAGANYTVDGLESMQFSITNLANFAPERNTALIAKLSGDMQVKGSIPVAELKRKLAGLPLADTKPVISSYSAVIDVPKSSGELFPSWATAVPKDENRIKVVIKD